MEEGDDCSTYPGEIEREDGGERMNLSVLLRSPQFQKAAINSPPRQEEGEKRKGGREKCHFIVPASFFWRGLNYVSGESALPPRKICLDVEGCPTHGFVQNQQKYSIIIASVVTWAERVLVCVIRIHAIHYMRTLVGIINLMLKDGTKFGFRFQLYRLTFHNGKGETEGGRK